MASSHFPVSSLASASAAAFAIIVGQAGAQAPTQLSPAIRNFEWMKPQDRTPAIVALTAALPKLLSQTGLYRNIGNKTTRAISDTSVVPFQVNSALWSDGSHKERFISLLPGTKVTPTDTSKYTFPDGAVLIKNFLIDTVHGDITGNGRIFVETRFLVYQSGPAGKSWSGISYRWKRDQSDAELVHPDSGLDYTHNVRLNGQMVGKRWRYPSSQDCRQCHQGNDFTTGRGSLGFITPQLNRVINGTNQLQTLFMRGTLSANPVAGKPTAHRWYGVTEDSIPLEKRVRSYFASNCSHCHSSQILMSNVNHDFDYFDPSRRYVYQVSSDGSDDISGAWLGKPSKSGGGLDYLALPGYPDSSNALLKMKTRMDEYLPLEPSTDQMPPLATYQPDSAAVKLIEQWICSLKTGTPCNKVPWAPDETFWAPESISVALHPRGKFKDPAFQPTMRRGLLSVPAHIAAGGVELRDYRGRKLALVQEGKGIYRLPMTLTPGIYFLVAGQHRISLNYIP